MECTKCYKIKDLIKGRTICKECCNKESKKYYEKKKKEIKNIVIDITKKKICSKCNEEKTLDKYHIHKGKGTIRAACKACASKARKEYYKKNKEATIKKTTEYQNNRRKIDPQYRLRRNLRCRLYHALKNQKASKSDHTLELLGCSMGFLKGYLEAKFKEGMTWDNYGKWHVDHIRCVSDFDLSDKEEQKKCFHYTNLQPLWASENLSKSNELLSPEKLAELSNLQKLSELELKTKKQKKLLEEKNLIKILPKDKKKCKKKHNQNLPKYIYYRESHGGKYKGYVVEHPNGTKRFGKKIFTLEENLHKAKVYLATLINIKKGEKESPSI